MEAAFWKHAQKPWMHDIWPGLAQQTYYHSMRRSQLRTAHLQSKQLQYCIGQCKLIDLVLILIYNCEVNYDEFYELFE